MPILETILIISSLANGVTFLLRQRAQQEKARQEEQFRRAEEERRYLEQQRAEQQKAVELRQAAAIRHVDFSLNAFLVRHVGEWQVTGKESGSFGLPVSQPARVQPYVSIVNVYELIRRVRKSVRSDGTLSIVSMSDLFNLIDPLVPGIQSGPAKQQRDQQIAELTKQLQELNRLVQEVDHVKEQAARGKAAL